ncbi:MAG TPA: hypothetical protein VKZ53_23860 [Candidatus Angelobacter sp.]|nr:hypothetical protein [Candidatus Angelobacter sp.]
MTVVRRIAFLSTAVAFFFLGCSSKPEADAGNLSDLINQKLDKRSMCIEVGKLPGKVYDSGGKDLNDLLVTAGLLDRSSVKEGYSRYKVYSLSALGTPYYHDNKNLCYATLEITEVKSFSAPGTGADGRFVSHVEYSYHAKDIAPWALKDEIKGNYIRVRQVIESRQTPLSATASLSRTDKGWQVDDLGIREVWGKPL